MPIDVNLVYKYKTQAPRYTSYPSAPHFEEVQNDKQHKEITNNILSRNRRERNISLYVHLPFCASLCWYCGCTTVITRKQGNSKTYLDYVEKELAGLGKLLNKDNQVVQVHLGGGTPTFLLPEEIIRLGSMMSSRFSFNPDAENAVEIDPRRLTREHITALKTAGFNRASIGLQDFNPKVQKAVNRIQPYSMTKETIDWLRKDEFRSINIDLIYGLPHQTVDSFRKTLDQVLLLKPDRLAVFSYAHVPWMKPAQKHLDRYGLPTTEEKFSMLCMTVQTLTENGYRHIGMDHFARNDDELAIAQSTKQLQRNFQGYSTWADTDIYALGMSSISQVGNMYVQNTKELPVYYKALDDGQSTWHKFYHLTEDDQIRRKVIMRLMCDMELNYAKMSSQLNIHFEEYFQEDILRLQSLKEDGLVSLDSEGLTVTDSGRLFLRNIAMQFDVRSRIKTTQSRYSQSI
ncbi:MAG: oxygen-independent coproporphyrinogen III oxidase [Balneolales bacterium]